MLTSNPNPWPRLLIDDGRTLESVSDESYDVVMAFHVLEHFADPLRALSAWRRVLKPGGRMLLSVPFPPSTYDSGVPVSTIYDLILAHADDADAPTLSTEAAAALERRVAAYPRLRRNPSVSDACLATEYLRRSRGVAATRLRGRPNNTNLAGTIGWWISRSVRSALPTFPRREP